MNRCCPICCSNKKELLYDLFFDFESDYYLPSHNQLVCCNKCGFVFADNDSSQEKYDLYYSKNDSYAFSDSIKYSSNDDLYIDLYLNTITKYICKEDSFVDVGCGDGSMLLRLKELGYEKLTGIDTSSVTIDELNNKGIKGIVSSIFDLDEHFSDRFSVVISTGVAEHIYDLKNYTLNLIRLMKDDGKLIIIVPAIEGFSKKYTSLPNYFNHEHINYFSCVSMDNLMGIYGLKNIATERYLIDCNGEYLLIGIYIKGIETSHVLEYDSISKESVMVFLMSHNKIKHINAKIFKGIKDKDFILWGTGSMAVQFLAIYPELKKRIRYCIDNNPGKWGTLFSGKEVIKPEKISGEDKELPIVICSMLNAQDIVAQIRQMNIENEFFVCL